MADNLGYPPGNRSGAPAQNPWSRPGSQTGQRWAVGNTRGSDTDPIDPWEVPLLKQDRWRVSLETPARAFRPAGPEFVPPAAMSALTSVCGPLTCDQLYVLPRTTRLLSSGQCVMTPTRVLGFGEQSVGFWVEDSPWGHVVGIPHERLLAVENTTILLYGRLELVTSRMRLVVRYAVTSGEELVENLCELRARLATVALPTNPGFLWLDPYNRPIAPEYLPHKWRRVLDRGAVRPRPEEPVVVAVGSLAETGWGGTRCPTGVALLGPRELIIATEPAESIPSARFGVDILAVPRRFISSLRWDGRSLTVRLVHDQTGIDTASLALVLDPRLVETMAYAFGPAVRWA